MLTRARLFPIGLTLFIAACAASDETDEDLGADEGAVSAQDLANRGESQVKFPVAGRPDEVCVISKKGGGAYSPDDLKAEKKLCNANFRSGAPGEEAALCPKDSSTNPGVYLHKLEGKSKSEVEAAGCNTDKIGVFKQSVTCSYSGSILGYYHLSRYLGNAANVPVSVIRTMDLDTHKAIVERGIAATKKVDGAGFDVHDAWKQYQGMDRNPAGFSRAAQVYTADFKQLYGAIMNKVSDDGRHPMMRTGGGAPGLNQFIAGPTFAIVKDGKPLAERFSKPVTDKETLQGLIVAKDASDMVLMDELMSQQDRYGNVHSVAFKVFEENGVLKKIKLDKGDDEKFIDRPDVNGIVVEELVLRDNDCGVSKTNLAAAANGGRGVVALLSHMSSHTYKHFMFFATEINKQDSTVQRTMLNETLFTATDLKKVADQAKKLATTLKSRCESGALQLDADLKDRIAGKTFGKDACSVAEAPTLKTPTEGGHVDSHGIELVDRKKQ